MSFCHLSSKMALAGTWHQSSPRSFRAGQYECRNSLPNQIGDLIEEPRRIGTHSVCSERRTNRGTLCMCHLDNSTRTIGRE